MKDIFKIDEKRVKARIEEIDRRLKFLSKTAKVDRVRFLTDHFIFTSAERDLQITIQACIDIANHLVAKINLEKPQKDNKEVFPILAKHKIISSSLAKKLVKMAGQRNILVHEYLQVEKEVIYETINNSLGDVVEFVKFIQKFIDEQKG